MSLLGISLVLLFIGVFSAIWKTAGQQVDAENKRIARELASLDYWEAEAERRAEYLRTHNNIPAWWWKD
jgi:hypothetical protein